MKTPTPGPMPLQQRLMDMLIEQLSLAAGMGPQGQAAPSVQTDEELWTYVADTWAIQIPRQSICAGHTSPFDAFADAYFARDHIMIWEGSRGFAGKSFLLSILGLTIACTRGGDVNILGGSGEQSKRVHQYMADAWNAPHAPRHLLRSDPMLTRTRLSNGSRIQALLASSASVRGPHIPTLLLDEADEMDLAIFDAAMGQTMSKPGQPALTVISSTHHYPDGTFSELMRRAKAHGWRHARWCFRESQEPHGWLETSEISRKRRETTDAMWRTEYELQEPSATDRAILPEAVEAMFDPALGHYTGAPGEYIECEAPVRDGRYAHGADWAKTQDWTEIITWRTDVSPARLVAYERLQRQPWPAMVGRFEARLTRYGGSEHGHAGHDGTGLGDVVDGYLSRPATKLILVGRVRADLFSQFISAIENHELLAPAIEALRQQYLYCSTNDLYGSGHPPDGFVAGAIGWAVRDKHVAVQPPVLITQESLWIRNYGY